MDAPEKARLMKTVVAEGLALRILKGEYRPGQPIPAEAILLGEFGVSRTCLREALQMLTATGLVYSRPKLGTLVRDPLDWNFLDADLLRWRRQVVSKQTFLRELFTVRRMVEPETAALAAENATPEMIAALQNTVMAMARGNGERTEGTLEADVAFHRLLLAASGNAMLSGLGACIEEALRASISITSAPGVGSKFALDKHVDVFEAIRDRKPAAARKHMNALLDMTWDVVARTGLTTADIEGDAALPVV
jgi:DNA-binding FadR family transcriptional regulator